MRRKKRKNKRDQDECKRRKERNGNGKKPRESVEGRSKRERSVGARGVGNCRCSAPCRPSFAWRKREKKLMFVAEVERGEKLITGSLAITAIAPSFSSPPYLFAPSRVPSYKYVLLYFCSYPSHSLNFTCTYIHEHT